MNDKPVQYKKKILKELSFGNALSAQELSVCINRSLPLTTKILNELAEEGLLQERGYASSTGGRRPVIYSLAPGKIFVVSVAMDQLVTKIGIIDLQNCEIGYAEKLNLTLTNNTEALFILIKIIKNFIEKCGIERSKIVGVGIGMPGFVDAAKGINYTFMNNTGTSIVSAIEDELNLAVYIDNDSSIIALTELRLGMAHHKKNAMVINIGWGVGLGMILNGKLFRGFNGFAGEFSHLPVFKDNKKICSCGKTGCLETETSLLMIISKAIAGLKNGKMSVLKNLSIEDAEQSWKAIINAAFNGDTFAIELFSEAGYNLGLGISILITLLNPELIILSGRGAAIGKLWLPPIQQAINEHCIPKIAEDTQIKISTFGQKVDLIGAAALVMEHYGQIDAKLLNKTLKEELV